MIKLLEDFRNRLEAWEREAGSPWLGGFIRFLRFLVVVLIEFYRDRCLTTASALTFTSLLSLVPVTTAFFAIYSRFPAFQRLQGNVEQFLYKHLIAEPDLQQTVSEYLHQFTAATNNVTMISVIALFVTAISTFLTIEFAMNVIWAVRRSRPFLDSLSHFTALLVWGPLLIGFSTFLSHKMLAERSLALLFGQKWVVWIFTVCVSWLMFFLIYVLIPYTRVRLRPALMGSFVAANLWEFAKLGFGVYVGHSHFYTSVYGNLSTIPIFLMWVYVTWVITLFGAEISYCLQYRTLMRAGAGFTENLVFKGQLAVLIMVDIARKFHDGQKGCSLDYLSDRYRLPPENLQDILVELESAGLTCLSANGGGGLFLPGRALETITFAEILNAVYPRGTLERLTRNDGMTRYLREIFDRLENARAEVLGEIVLADAIHRAEENGAS